MGTIGRCRYNKGLATDAFITLWTEPLSPQVFLLLEPTPPIFLAHGGDDIISSPNHSVLAYLALKRAGIPAELHVYTTAAHDFGVRASDHPCSTWTQSCTAWLRHQGFLKPGPRL
jgi:acetyl esterase/lipase